MPESTPESQSAPYAAEVRVLWGEDTLLSVTHLKPGDTWRLPANLIPVAEYASALEFVATPSSLAMSIPAGAQVEGDVNRKSDDGPDALRLVDLEPGREMSMHVGPLRVEVAFREYEDSKSVGWRALVAGFSLGSLRYFAGTFGVASLLAIIMSLVPPVGQVAASDMLDSQRRLLEVATLPAEVLFEDPITDPSASGDSGAAAEPAPGPEGSAGDETSPRTNRRYAIRERRADAPEELPREALEQAAREQGTIGVLASMQDAWNTPTSPYSTATPNGSDPMDALGALIGDQPGQNFGHGGLGMRGTGRDGGGRPHGTLGVGAYNTECMGCGGSGNTRRSLAGNVTRDAARGPTLRPGRVTTTGGLGSDMIRRVVRRNLSQVRHCYEQQLQTRPDLEGRVTVAFMISPAGAVQASTVSQSSVANPAMEQCIARSVRRWSFPRSPDGSISSVRYPFSFRAQ